jgi:hypothetical protein
LYKVPQVAVAAAKNRADGRGQGGRQFEFYRVGNDLTQELDVNYVVGGTATRDTDYTPLVGVVKSRPARKSVPVGRGEQGGR